MGLQVFRIQNIHGSSGGGDLHVLRFGREDNQAQIAAWRKDYERILFCIYFCMCGRQKPEDHLSPMADDAITQGDIGGPGSLVYICGVDPNCIESLQRLIVTYYLNHHHLIHLYYDENNMQ